MVDVLSQTVRNQTDLLSLGSWKMVLTPLIQAQEVFAAHFFAPGEHSWTLYTLPPHAFEVQFLYYAR